jgi:hypothetical protein
MRFNLRIKKFNHTVFLMISESQTLEGVTSLQSEGKHIVLWDLENCSLEQAEITLRKVQKKYCLSHIFIVSDIERSYRAWCFSKVDLKSYLKSLLDTDFLDWNFFYWTVKRGKATLRTTNKKNREPQKIVSVLESYPVPIPVQFEKVIYDTGIEKRGLTVLLGKGGKILNG